MFEERISRVYILLDSGNRITRIEGGYTVNNIKDFSDWLLIDEGVGDRYNLCQSNYLPEPLTDDRGIYRYCYTDGQVYRRSAAEMDADYHAPPKKLSEIEMLQKQIDAQNEILDFYESCIAEMAEIVYA